MNFAVIPWGKEYLGNRIFASEEGGLNRENRLTPFYDMKCYMEKKKDRMDTIDMYNDLDQVDFFLFFELDIEWVKKIVKSGYASKMIYCNAEPAVVNNYNCGAGYKKLEHIFPYILTWDDDLVDEIHIFKRVIPYYPSFHMGEILYENRKLITNISGNKHSSHPFELYSERERVISFFEKNKDFTLRS